MRSISARTLLSVLVLIVAGAMTVWTGGTTPSIRGADRYWRAEERPVPAAMGEDSHEQTLESYAKLPIAFAENRGQLDTQVRYYAQGSRYAFYFTPEEAVLSLTKGTSASANTTLGAVSLGMAAQLAAAAENRQTQGVALALRFLGSNPQVVVEGQERAPGEVNYLRGSDPARWQTGLPRYAQVVYRELWKGVDLALHEQAGKLKYEFRLRPGAQVADIRLGYRGADGLTLDREGGLQVETALGTLRDSAPVSYQEIAGTRTPVESRYVLNGGAEYGFAVDAGYDPSHELIIDPGLDYSTLLGGASDDMGNGIAADAAGNAYIVGTTQSPDFPTTLGAFKRTGATSNFSDVFVTKLNPTGTALVYSTFIGGSNFDFGRGIAIDAAGNAYVTGQTKSSSFPTTGGAFDRTFNVDTCPRCGIDQYDAFALKLNAAGSGLVYSTFLGGFDIDDGLGIAVDAAGSAYVTGETGSLNFPTTPGAFDTSMNGAFDAFVTKLNPTGSALAYSTYLGGTAVDFGSRVAVNTAGNAFVMGSTSSADLPTTAGAFDTSANGGFDVFVTKLAANGSSLVYSTFLGGSDSDGGGGLKIDAAGNAYVAGGTSSADFPITPGAFDTSPADDAFVAKLNPAGSALVYSTALGGTDNEGASGVALDSAGNAWVTGGTSSADFPTTAGSFDNSLNGMADVFVAELNPAGSALLYSTYLGAASSEFGADLALDPAGNAYVTGHTSSLDFPTTVGAFDTIFNGDPLTFWGDGFVAKFAIGRTTSAPLSAPGVPTAPSLIAPVNADTPSQPITFQWGIASDAASYTIQIDDSSTFSAPLVRERQNITDGMYATSGLATTQHFWRVRGVNSAGVAGPWSAVRSFTPQEAPPPATLSTFSTSPSTIVGGNDGTGTVVLNVSAPEGGAVVALSSSNAAVLRVPASVTVPSIGFAGTFVFTTAAVPANTLVTITAAYNGTTRTENVTVTPPAPPPPPASLQSLALSPASVTGGSSVQGFISLSGVAPQAGAVVSLSSSNPAVASVPASVTVAAGATSATFAVNAASVSASTAATISAVYNGVTRTAALTVLPPSSGPLAAPTLLGPAASARFSPGQAITFDWSDVAGAANYTIQIDDSQSFSTPLTVDQTTAASQFTTSTLPTSRMWWRVRANDAAGVPGSWSAARRFEVKN